MTSRLFLVVVCYGFGWVFQLGAAEAQPSIVVEKRPVELSYKTYQMDHPPPRAKGSIDREAGLCEYSFGCANSVKYEMPQFSLKPASVTFRSVEVTLTLIITIWTAEGTGPEVLAHEETHRSIAEHFYRNADRIARRVAQEAVGRKLTFSGKAQPTAAREAVNALQQSISTAILKETHDRCGTAQVKFDEITDHGRADVTNADALARSLADEEVHWRLQQRPSRIISQDALSR